MAAIQDESNDQLQHGTGATLTNDTKADMQLIKSFSWSGDFTSLPETIPSDGGSVRFDHLKDSQGSKAAVCYTTGAACAVVLAWSAPADFNPSTSPNKVYGAIASRCIIDIVTWDQIQMLLDKSESSVETDIDGVRAEATILNNPATKMADLQANFLSSPTISHEDIVNNIVNNNDNDNKDDDDNNSDDN